MRNKKRSAYVSAWDGAKKTVSIFMLYVTRVTKTSGGAIYAANDHCSSPSPDFFYGNKSSNAINGSQKLSRSNH